MTWKNLHFRPPILTEKVVDGVASKLLFIRYKDEPDTAFAGYVLLRKSDSSVYHICGRGVEERQVVYSHIEWMEVPE